MCRQTKSDHVVLSSKSVSYLRWFLFRFSTNVPPSALPQRITDAAKSLQRLGWSLGVSPGRSGYSVSEDIRPITRPAVHTVNGSWCLSASQHHLLQLPAAAVSCEGCEARKPKSSADDCWRVSTRVEGQLMPLSPLSQWHIKPSHFLLFFFSSLIPQTFFAIHCIGKKTFIWIYKKWFAKSPLRTCGAGMSNFCTSVEPELSKCVYWYDCTVIWAPVLYRHVSGVHS